MHYLNDVFFENFNIVHRMGEFFSADPNEEWTATNVIFEQSKFYFITSGSCTIELDKKVYFGKPGDWFFIPPNHYHSYRKSSDCVFSKYFVHFDMYPAFDLFHDLSLSYKVSVPEDSKVYQLFERYSQISESYLFTDKLEVKSILLQLLSEYISLSTTNDTLVNFQLSGHLRSVLTYINENLHTSLPNNLLAELCHLHTNHFIRVFKEQIGQTPQRYILQKRMENAKHLVEVTTLSFNEIAEISFICDSAQFSKTFKRFFGMTPSQYRKMANKKDRSDSEQK